jgi:hypothetical protein
MKEPGIRSILEGNQTKQLKFMKKIQGHWAKYALGDYQ